MSGVKVLRAMMAAHAPLTALVPLTRISSGVLPRDTALPAILLTRISGMDMNIPSPGAVRHVSERDQVTVLAADYVSMLAVMTQVRAACADKRPDGTPLGLAEVTVHTDLAGPDFMNEESGIHMRSQDFMVKYNEAR